MAFPEAASNTTMISEAGAALPKKYSQRCLGRYEHPHPKWLKESQNALKLCAESYRDNIKAIAESLAQHDRAERVLI